MTATAEQPAATVQSLDRLEPNALEAMTRGQIDVQIATAQRFPRSVKGFVRDALDMATLDQETAEACFYALPRAGKTIEGPSARLAEIIASAWGHMRVEGRVIEESDRFVTARGTAWDVQRNVAMAVEVRRRITDKRGKRYADDMIGVTANAAIAIALRNAVFKVVPSAYTRHIYAQCREVAVGKAETLSARRDRALGFFTKLGVSAERVCATLEVNGVEDITLDHLATLQGLKTAIREGDTSIEEAFGGNGIVQPKRKSETAAAQPTNTAGAQARTPEPEPTRKSETAPAETAGAPEQPASQSAESGPGERVDEAPATEQPKLTDIPAQALISLADQRKVFRVAREHGRTADQVKSYIRGQGFDGVKSITVEGLPAILDWAARGREPGEDDEG